MNIKNNSSFYKMSFSDFKSDENIEYSICRILSSEMFFDILNAYQEKS